MPSIHIIYASTSGHTEYVVDLIAAYLKEHVDDIEVTLQRAEEAQVEDLDRGDILCLASSTWNTGGTEGMLNPHMFTFAHKRAKTADLSGKQILLIGLGDQRYTFTVRAADKLQEFVEAHGGTVLGEPLRIVNEPYHQNKKVEEWVDTILSLPEMRTVH